MTLFQAIAMWSLRAIVLWGSVELCLAGYERAQSDLAKWSLVSGHEAAAARLERKALAAEVSQVAQVKSALPSEVRLPGGAEAALGADMLFRDLLVAAGAQDIEIKARLTDPGAPTTILEGDVAWSEQPDGAARGLRAMAAHYPMLTVNTVSMSAQPSGSVRTILHFKTLAGRS